MSMRLFTVLFLAIMIQGPARALDVGPMANSFESEAQILQGYRLQSEIMDPHDVRGLFLRIYEQITLEVEAMLDRHEFQNEAWVRNLVRQYANLYREAFVLSEINPAGLPDAWKLAFADVDIQHKPPAYQLLTAINAHVNRDLPYALMRAGTDFKSPSMKKDFVHISTSFGRRMQNLWGLLREYDSCTRIRPEKLIALATINWAMGVTRDRAWNRGEVLSHITDPKRLADEERSLETYAVGQYHKIKVNPATDVDEILCRIERRL